jgi:hypothetical protein
MFPTTWVRARHIPKLACGIDASADLLQNLGDISRAVQHSEDRQREHRGRGERKAKAL